MAQGAEDILSTNALEKIADWKPCKNCKGEGCSECVNGYVYVPR